MTVDRPLANALDLEVVHEISRAAFPRRCRKPRQRALTIADMGSDRQIERWLPAIAAGELIATIQPSGGPFAVVDSSFDLIVVASEDCLRVVPVGNFDIESHEVEEGSACRLSAPKPPPIPCCPAAPDGRTFYVRAAVAAATTLVGIGAY